MSASSPPEQTIVLEAGEERPMKPNCVHGELLADQSLVLHNTCTGQSMTLNPTAALIWECCDGEHSLAMILDEVREVFPGAQQIEGDVIALLKELIANAMVFDPGL